MGVITASNQEDVAIVGILDAAEVVREIRVVRIVCIPDHVRCLVANVDRHDTAGVLDK